jgi:hypothetical protein
MSSVGKDRSNAQQLIAAGRRLAKPGGISRERNSASGSMVAVEKSTLAFR